MLISVGISYFYLLLLGRYFHVDANSPAPLKTQAGTMRTNCMDNLDRTNVAQAAFAKWTLNRQLKVLGILPADGTIDDYEGPNKDFRECWSTLL
jgi:hypothetical protein